MADKAMKPRRGGARTALLIGVASGAVAGVTACAVARAPVRTAEQRPGYRVCVAGDVNVVYRGGEMGSGNDFGSLNLLNTAPTACRLPSTTLTITPLDSAGRAMETGAGWRRTADVGGLVLSARGAVPANGAAVRSGDQWAQVLLGGNFRDDPSSADGLCPANEIVRPAQCRLRGFLDRTVENIDPSRSATSERQPASLYACADPALQLVNVSTSQQP
jgi:hypothetical protein